ncbi:MAG: hypothetical protein MUP85_11485 [Candidatus Lokiarchaeota archaeon]|nr:hypothetical protein [Candidatus Lokiarchaeota archaeon]
MMIIIHIMKNVKLEVNDKEIALNEIMTKVISNIINGFLDALNDIPEVRKKINLEISL